MRERGNRRKKERGRKGEWGVRRGGDQEEKKKKKKKKKKKEERQKWDTCPILGDWEEIMLSPPNQLCAYMWQGESPFYFKKPNF
jgi:hypothetical protein